MKILISGTPKKVNDVKKLLRSFGVTITDVPEDVKAETGKVDPPKKKAKAAKKTKAKKTFQ
jgi:hypothetical protein